MSTPGGTFVTKPVCIAIMWYPLPDSVEGASPPGFRYWVVTLHVNRVSPRLLSQEWRLDRRRLDPLRSQQRRKIVLLVLPHPWHRVLLRPNLLMRRQDLGRRHHVVRRHLNLARRHRHHRHAHRRAVQQLQLPHQY